ncbi:phosphatidylinositol-specific phospholipase C1-like protein [Sphingomonas sp. LH128]|uniref:phosphatidylinositol-specific phospholipase C1-like protein n=1 Tax=Sphingomonas sp. LH128 TaxID=473781 RepID=UPI000561349A|nr:Ca2+-dependent phosphoinositide-specific phospholipase C [Sphingomonas sp. LH128]
MLLLATAAAVVAAPACAEEIRMNDIQTVGTHNSYKGPTPPETLARIAKINPADAISKDYQHRPIPEQLDAGARAFEFDANYDPKGDHYVSVSNDPDMAKPGFKIMHVAGIDGATSCLLLTQCMTQLKTWSDAHPDHAPILIMFNMKAGQNAAVGGVDGIPFTEAAYDALDAEIRSVLPKSKIITPDEVQGKYPTLREAVMANNWPTLKKARGRFLFAMDEKADKIAMYRGSRKNLEGRVFFVNAEESSPVAGYMTINDPIVDAEKIKKMVAAGFLVRTRGDAGTHQARSNDTTRQKAAFASGAQYILTDYIWPDTRFAGGYTLRLPNGAAAVCNPLHKPASCSGILEKAQK